MSTKYEAKSHQWTPLAVDAVSIRLIKTQQKRSDVGSTAPLPTSASLRLPVVELEHTDLSLCFLEIQVIRQEMKVIRANTVDNVKVQAELAALRREIADLKDVRASAPQTVPAPRHTTFADVVSENHPQSIVHPPTARRASGPTQVHALRQGVATKPKSLVPMEPSQASRSSPPSSRGHSSGVLTAPDEDARPVDIFVTRLGPDTKSEDVERHLHDNLSHVRTLSCMNLPTTFDSRSGLGSRRFQCDFGAFRWSHLKPASGASFTASGGTTSAFGRDTLGGGHQQADISYDPAPEVFAAINRLQNGKACDSDGLSAEHLKHAGPRPTILLLLLVSAMLVHGHVPPILLRSNKTLTSQLDRLVNRAARLITGHKLRDHVPVNILRAEAGIDPVRKRAEVASLVSVFKAVRGCAPVYMTSLFKWEAPPTLSVRTTRKSHFIQEQLTVLWTLPLELTPPTTTTAAQSQNF
ncbi:ATP-binding cassette sub- A member 5 [Branchiostoma belcheri]|nr:ATP-binding cassette sub- A member 5 [Branchiostoma belcheri]